MAWAGSISAARGGPKALQEERERWADYTVAIDQLTDKDHRRICDCRGHSGRCEKCNVRLECKMGCNDWYGLILDGEIFCEGKQCCFCYFKSTFHSSIREGKRPESCDFCYERFADYFNEKRSGKDFQIDEKVRCESEELRAIKLQMEGTGPVVMTLTRPDAMIEFQMRLPYGIGNFTASLLHRFRITVAASASEAWYGDNKSLRKEHVTVMSVVSFEGPAYRSHSAQRLYALGDEMEEDEAMDLEFDVSSSDDSDGFDAIEAMNADSLGEKGAVNEDHSNETSTANLCEIVDDTESCGRGSGSAPSVFKNASRLMRVGVKNSTQVRKYWGTENICVDLKIVLPSIPPPAKTCGWQSRTGNWVALGDQPEINPVNRAKWSQQLLNDKLKQEGLMETTFVSVGRVRQMGTTIVEPWAFALQEGAELVEKGVQHDFEPQSAAPEDQLGSGEVGGTQCAVGGRGSGRVSPLKSYSGTEKPRRKIRRLEQELAEANASTGIQSPTPPGGGATAGDIRPGQQYRWADSGSGSNPPLNLVSSDVLAPGVADSLAFFEARYKYGTALAEMCSTYRAAQKRLHKSIGGWFSIFLQHALRPRKALRLQHKQIEPMVEGSHAWEQEEDDEEDEFSHSHLLLDCSKLPPSEHPFMEKDDDDALGQLPLHYLVRMSCVCKGWKAVLDAVLPRRKISHEYALLLREGSKHLTLKRVCYELDPSGSLEEADLLELLAENTTPASAMEEVEE